MDALALAEGVRFRGDGAHSELIDYIAKRHSLSEQTRVFLQQMRDYRNRIEYEGFSVNKNYISANEKIINSIIKKLFDKLSG